MDWSAMARFGASRTGTLVIYVLLAMVFAGALAVRFSSPAAPISDRDTWGYLSPATTLITEGELSKTHRSFPYPAFLYVTLRCFNSFIAITVVQTCLGLLSGLFLWMAWLRLARWIPRAREELDFPFKLIGVLMLMVYLHAVRMMVLERTIRPEGTFPFFATLHILLSLVLCDAAFQNGRRGKVWLLAGCLTFNAFLMYMWRPNWACTIPLSLMPLLVVWWVRPVPRWGLSVAAGAGAFVFLTLIMVPETLLNRKFSDDTRPMLPTWLLCIHAKPIRDVMVEDLNDPRPTRYDRQLLKDVVDSFDIAFSNPPKAVPYPTLGFDPDFIMYRQPLCRQIYERLGKSWDNYTTFCTYYYGQAWKRRTAVMVRKVIKELGEFYRFNSRVALRGESHKSREVYAGSLPIVDSSDRPGVANYPAFIRYVETVRQAQGQPGEAKPSVKTTSKKKGKPDPGEFRQWKQITILQKAVDCFYLVLLIVFGLVSVRVFRNKDLADYRKLFAVGLWLFTFNFGMTLTAAIIHSLKISRYTDVQYQFTLFSCFASLAILIVFLCGSRRPVATGLQDA